MRVRCEIDGVAVGTALLTCMTVEMGKTVPCPSARFIAPASLNAY